MSAGVGAVEGSDTAAELTETQYKLQALLAASTVLDRLVASARARHRTRHQQTAPPDRGPVRDRPRRAEGRGLPPRPGRSPRPPHLRPGRHLRPGGEGKEENQGFDAFLPLIDSGISVYVWTAARFVATVLFTCKPFDAAAAAEFTTDFLQLGDVESQSF